MFSNTKKLTKKEKEKFNKGVQKLITKYKATKNNEDRYEIITIGGKYTFRIDDDSSYVLSIFGRFEDVDRAKEYINCNPYSGKHNFHTYSAESILYQFEDFLEALCEVNGVILG